MENQELLDAMRQIVRDEIGQTENRLDQRISSLGKRIDEVEMNLGKRIDEVEMKLGKRIDAVEQVVLDTAVRVKYIEINVKDIKHQYQDTEIDVRVLKRAFAQI